MELTELVVDTAWEDCEPTITEATTAVQSDLAGKFDRAVHAGPRDAELDYDWCGPFAFAHGLLLDERAVAEL